MRAAGNKPPYQIPSMSAIATMPWNGYTVASTFSGCGGSTLGYRLAGFRVAWANEFVPAARETYAANFPTTTLDPRDIRAVRGDDVLGALGLAVGDLDVLDGSPPCASFSTAGKRAEHWGQVKSYSDTKQRTDDLFFEYARLVRELRPRVFVAENVAGLVKGVAKGMFLRFLATFEACGYVVGARVLDAQWLGVPQMRSRLIFVGVRRDLGRLPAHPTPLRYRYSVRDALPHIAAVSCLLPGKQGGMQSADRPCPAVTTGDTGGNGRHAVEVLTSDGPRSLDRPAPTVQTHCRGESRLELVADARAPLSQIDPRARALTNADIARDVQPGSRRRFTIDELKRVCAFPDDFVLTGTYAQQWERLGRAVPPLMMAAIATTIRDRILAPEGTP